MNYIYSMISYLPSIVMMLNWIELSILIYIIMDTIYQRNVIWYFISEGIIFLLYSFLGILLFVYRNHIDMKVTEYQIIYLLLLILMIVFLVCEIKTIHFNQKNNKKITRNSIKEAFDNLHCAICFFNKAGILVLCNRQMHRLFFEFSGHDLQYVDELESYIFERKGNDVTWENNVCVFSDNSAWQFNKEIFSDEHENIYYQYVAIDVTELHENRRLLKKETQNLTNKKKYLQDLYDKVLELAREEEILSMKMRVHNEMGGSLVAAQKYLSQKEKTNMEDIVITSWQRVIQMLKYNKEEQKNEEMLVQLQKMCSAIGLLIHTKGSMPENKQKAYLFITAIRECATNAVRYANATNLYVVFDCNLEMNHLKITNDGDVPKGEIIEGGGLSNLRKKVEKIGGYMYIESHPQFCLSVKLPLEGDEII